MGYQTITDSIHSRAICNYSLSKFTIDPKSQLAEVLETYPEYIAFVVNELAKNQNPADRYDAYTLRKKANTNKISAKELVNYAKKRGYSEVISAFCRSAYDDEDKTQYYSSKENKLFDNSIFKSWEEIAEFEKTQQRLVKPSTFPKKEKIATIENKEFFQKEGFTSLIITILTMAN